MRFGDFFLSVFLRNSYGFGGIGEEYAQATHQAWVVCAGGGQKERLMDNGSRVQIWIHIL